MGVRGGGQNEISGQGAECLAEGLQVWGWGVRGWWCMVQCFSD